MPTNLPPEYFDAEQRFRAATSDADRILCLEEMLSVIPKHKGTDKLRADYRRKLSQLKVGLQAAKKTDRHGSAFHIEKEGPVRIVVIGAPNTGKSALVAAVTRATPKVSEYEFTTWTPTPGMMPVRDIQLQLIDTPALSREHIEPEMFNLIRTADLILLLLDLQSDIIGQFEEAVGILKERHIALCERPGAQMGDGRVLSIPCIVLVNKTDDARWDEEFQVFRELYAEKWPLLPISVKTGRNLEQMKEIVFEIADIMRIYSKQPGKDIDNGAPFVMRNGATVAEFAARVHKDFVHNLKTARIWGAGVHDGQMVGRDHILHDGDIVELHT